MTTSIEIDVEVHKAIENGRNNFAETPNVVLRRLLGIDPRASVTTPNGKSYVYGKLELPHGTEAKMNYNNVSYTAQIQDGFWITQDGQRHKSPSGAASALAVTKSGGKTKLDGWGYWHVRKPGSPDFVNLTDLWKAAEGRL